MTALVHPIELLLFKIAMASFRQQAIMAAAYPGSFHAIAPYLGPGALSESDRAHYDAATADKQDAELALTDLIPDGSAYVVGTEVVTRTGNHITIFKRMTAAA